MLTMTNIETYYGSIRALKGVSLDVPEGRTVTLLGANGAGKTTTLKTISGITPLPVAPLSSWGSVSTVWQPEKIVRLGISHVRGTPGL